MIVTCPNCSTHFKVPEVALGLQGRTVKCARCRHIWHATRASARPEPTRASPARQPSTRQPSSGASSGSARKPAAAAPARAFPSPKSFDDDEEDIPLPPPKAKAKPALPNDDEVVARMFADHDASGDLALAEIDQVLMGDSLEESLEEGEDPFAEMSDLMRSREPESAADSQPLPKPVRGRRGGMILWVLVVAVLLAAAAAGLYFFQDKILDRFPGLAKYYEMSGQLKDPVVGVGLSFRNYNSERLAQDNTEILLVRGVIANDSAVKRTIPPLRVALYHDQKLLQFKVVAPPQATLDPKASVGFKISLDQPDPNASRFEVTFDTGKSPEAKP